MTELYAAVSDALMRAPAPVYMAVPGTPVERLPRPWYLPAPPPQTRAEYLAALAKLGALGVVKGRPE
jgi:hypothetical protein